MNKMELLEPIVAILDQKGIRKDGMHIKKITEQLMDDNMFLASMGYEEVKNMAKSLLDEHSKKGGKFERIIHNKKKKPGYYRIKKERTQPLPDPYFKTELDLIEETSDNESQGKKGSTNFFGKAGEYAVMSELLFQEYNANNMTVDEGIDIIASKNNNFYFVQVKTMTLQSGHKARTTIKQKNFDKFINQQMRYVIAVKCSSEIKFFTLTNESIELLLHKQAIGRNKDGSLSIKIKYGENGSVYFYDNNEEEASFWEGVKIELRS